MSDPRRHQADQPSQEELEAYLEQLREADPGEVLAQAYTMLGTGAEVKLGRPDARVLIDAMAALTESVAHAVEADLVTRMRNGVVQLQTAQVQAERQAGGQQAPAEPSGTPSAPSGPGPAEARPAEGQSKPDSPVTDRLWIPGREPR